MLRVHLGYALGETCSGSRVSLMCSASILFGRVRCLLRVQCSVGFSSNWLLSQVCLVSLRFIVCMGYPKGKFLSWDIGIGIEATARSGT
jgi:hypothetical protein